MAEGNLIGRAAVYNVWRALAWGLGGSRSDCRVHQREQALKLAQAAAGDCLTGVLNRRACSVPVARKLAERSPETAPIPSTEISTQRGPVHPVAARTCGKR